jgi:hypothetical protein
VVAVQANILQLPEKKGGWWWWCAQGNMISCFPLAPEKEYKKTNCHLSGKSWSQTPHNKKKAKKEGREPRDL